jgi:hypothetical protein
MVSGEDFRLNQSTEVNSIFMAVELEFEGRFNGQELNRSDALPATGRGDLKWIKICHENCGHLWTFMALKS